MSILLRLRCRVQDNGNEKRYNAIEERYRLSLQAAAEFCESEEDGGLDDGIGVFGEQQSYAFDDRDEGLWM